MISTFVLVSCFFEQKKIQENTLNRWSEKEFGIGMTISRG